MMKTEGPTARTDTSRKEGSSTSQPTDDAFLPADKKGKGIDEDSYETSSDIDVTELRMMEEGFT